MLTIGDRFPEFRLKAVSSADVPAEFDEITHESFPGRWTVYVFWPKDFTFVCPTEILGFAERDKQFRERDAQLIGVSTDSEYVHVAWRQSREDLAAVPYPWLSDIKRELSSALGVLHRDEGVAVRATFIVDPDGVIRFVAVNDLDVGRDPREVLRVLDALQTEALTPCGWKTGDDTLAPPHAA